MRRPPRSTRTDTLFPYTTLFRSAGAVGPRHVVPTLGGSLRCAAPARLPGHAAQTCRSEEHTSELQSLMRISYAVFCLKKKTTRSPPAQPHHYTDDTRLLRNYNPY